MGWALSEGTLCMARSHGKRGLPQRRDPRPALRPREPPLRKTPHPAPAAPWPTKAKLLAWRPLSAGLSQSGYKHAGRHRTHVAFARTVEADNEHSQTRNKQES